MRNHFALQHFDHSITIAEEGPMPCCTSCSIFVEGAASKKHCLSLFCHALTARQQKYFAQFERQQVNDVSFQVNGVRIVKVYNFKNLGRILEETDNENLAAEQQLSRA